MKKIFRPNLDQRGQNLSQNQGFFTIFSSLVHQYSFKLHRMIAWNNILLIVVAKLTKKIGSSNLGHMTQNRAQNQVFCYFFKFGSLVFLEIAQDNSLEQCLGKTLEKILGAPNWIQIQGWFCTISSRFHHQFSLILPKTAAWDNV